MQYRKFEGPYDPVVKDLITKARDAGRREVVEWIELNYWLNDYGDGILNIDGHWQAKLKEWGIND